MSILQIGLPSIVRWLKRKKRAWRSRPAQLCLRETLALGERRFVAVVEFERQRFLIGGTGSSLSVLASVAGLPVSEGGAEEGPTWTFESGCKLQRVFVSQSRCG